jgi:hypothetical protein
VEETEASGEHFIQDSNAEAIAPSLSHDAEAENEYDDYDADAGNDTDGDARSDAAASDGEDSKEASEKRAHADGNVGDAAADGNVDERSCTGSNADERSYTDGNAVDGGASGNADGDLDADAGYGDFEGDADFETDRDARDGGQLASSQEMPGKSPKNEGDYSFEDDGDKGNDDGFEDDEGGPASPLQDNLASSTDYHSEEDFEESASDQ